MKPCSERAEHQHTLLFSIEHYQAVAEAYLRALGQRVGGDKPVDGLGRSLASFFVSRVDTLVDQLLTHRRDPDGPDSDGLPHELMGRIAVANAQVAYKYFKADVAGALVETGPARGASPTRLVGEYQPQRIRLTATWGTS